MGQSWLPNFCREITTHWAHYISNILTIMKDYEVKFHPNYFVFLYLAQLLQEMELSCAGPL